jgi:hypothetical protein
VPLDEFGEELSPRRDTAGVEQVVRDHVALDTVVADGFRERCETVREVVGDAVGTRGVIPREDRRARGDDEALRRTCLYPGESLLIRPWQVTRLVGVEQALGKRPERVQQCDVAVLADVSCTDGDASVVVPPAPSLRVRAEPVARRRSSACQPGTSVADWADGVARDPPTPRWTRRLGRGQNARSGSCQSRASVECPRYSTPAT